MSSRIRTGAFGFLSALAAVPVVVITRIAQVSRAAGISEAAVVAGVVGLELLVFGLMAAAFAKSR
jgi:hypothetical protein